jgi:DNA-binding transcriptional MocR family regulator
MPANQLADIKMLTSITTSQFTERLIYLMLVDGHYRKYLSRLHERLGWMSCAPSNASDWNYSLSSRTACSAGRASRILRTRWRWRKRRDTGA